MRRIVVLLAVVVMIVPASFPTELKCCGAINRMARIELELPEPLRPDVPCDCGCTGIGEGATCDCGDVLAPECVQNIAKDKPVISSEDHLASTALQQITDGNKAGVDGTVVKLPAGSQWIQIDLGDLYEVYGIAMWRDHAEAKSYKDVVIQLSKHDDFSKKVCTVFNNDDDNSLGLGRGKDQEYVETFHGHLVDAHGKKARYVRLYSNGNDAGKLNNYVEVEIFGRPAMMATY